MSYYNKMEKSQENTAKGLMQWIKPQHGVGWRDLNRRLRQFIQEFGE